ncbi:MAG: hypothetical protein HFE98_00790 [Ruminiclostridium sp.]|nr:hypothetical protein [Ruminiclostridium sp.]
MKVTFTFDEAAVNQQGHTLDDIYVPWLFHGVNESDVTDTGAQHSLKQLLEGMSMAQKTEDGSPKMLRATKNEREP